MGPFDAAQSKCREIGAVSALSSRFVSCLLCEHKHSYLPSVVERSRQGPAGLRLPPWVLVPGRSWDARDRY